jgi:AraC-like DNA-binding protein
MGARSWILLLFAVNGAALAALLLASRGNRAANRFLAALIALISLRLLIYVMGFAGLYDAYRWLAFAPLDASLTFGPLLWLYVEALTRGRPPRRWALHLLPGVVQIGYYAAAFALPVELKWRWYGGAHLEIVEPAALLALLVSAAAYLALAWRRQRGYQRWLDDRFGNREQWRLAWLSAILAAFAATLAAAAIAALVNALAMPLDYYGRFPVVLTSSLLAYALGLLGWRHAGLALPPQPLEPEEAPAPTGAGARFPDWSRRVAAGEWWRDEQLTLAGLAKHLAVSERSLSRGLREGGDCNFNAFINRFRVEAVQAAMLANPAQDLLSLALDHGFNSKASFNRAFRRYAGASPTAWRAAQKSPIAGATAI